MIVYVDLYHTSACLIWTDECHVVVQNILNPKDICRYRTLMRKLQFSHVDLVHTTVTTQRMVSPWALNEMDVLANILPQVIGAN